MAPRHIVLLAAAGGAWGSAFLFIHRALEGFGPVQIGVLRNAVAALVVGAVIAVAGGVGRSTLVALARRPGLALLTGAVGFAIPVIIVSNAERHLPSGLTAVILSSSPLLIALAAPWVAPEERVGRRGAIGLLVGFAGVALAVGAGDGSVSLGELPLLGSLILAAAMSAAYPLIVRRHYPGIPPTAITLHATIGGSVLLMPLLVLEPVAAPSAEAVLSLLALGAVATALPFLLFTILLGEVGASRASLAFFLIPATALLLGVAVLGEQASPTALLGLALILAGVRLAAVAEAAEELPKAKKGCTDVRPQVPHPQRPRGAQHPG